MPWPIAVLKGGTLTARPPIAGAPSTRYARRVRPFVVAALLLLGAVAPARAATICKIKFDLAGWSAFYQTADGAGVVSCDNGERAKVAVSTRGGGVTFGKWELTRAEGRFSAVRALSDVYGSYARAEVHAGAVGAAGAQVLTKGEVSLALSGTGRGWALGVAFGNLKIVPR